MEQNIVHENEYNTFVFKGGKYYRCSKITNKETEMKEQEVRHMYSHIQTYLDHEYYYGL